MADAIRNVATKNNTDYEAANDNRPPLRVIRSSDRAAELKDSTRNARTEVRTSSMPGAPTNQPYVSRKRDIATDFNKSYEQAGVGKSILDTDKTTRKNNTSKNNRTTQSTTITPAPIIKRSIANRLPRPRRYSKRSLAGQAFAKTKATGANIWLLSWCVWLWMWFLLPISILSVLFLGLAGAVEELESSWTNEDGNWVQNLASRIAFQVINTAESAVRVLVEYFFGIDISIFNPTNLFMFTNALGLFLGWTILLLCYFSYKFAFLNPLSGERANLKIGTFLVAFIGATIPIVNMFPWFVFWMIAVWFYPK